MQVHGMANWSRRSVLLAGLCVGACARFDRPPLGALYRPTQATIDQPPLIVIPGAFGSSLRERSTGREIWPGPSARLLVSSYRNLELDIDAATLEPLAGDIEAYDVFEKGLGQDFYGQVLRTLQRAGGYARCGACQKPRADRRNFYVYPYDFRLDNARAARGLHELIEQIRVDYGDPRLAVDILAHSNGGLLARHYARYGTAALPDSGPFSPTGAGAAAIRRMLLVGTPNLGTMQPVLSHLRGEEIGLNHIPQEVIATCTGAAEMMPHPAVPWLIDLQGRTLGHDLYDIETWRALGWSLFDPRVAERAAARHGGGAAGQRYVAMLQEYMARQLRRGRRFIESLAVPAPGMEPPLMVFGGDCELTLARILVEQVDGRFRGRERVADIAQPVPGVDYAQLMFEPGDIVVTRASLLGRRTLNIAAPRAEIESLNVAHTVFLCERHQQLTGNASFQDNLLNVLLSVDAA
jgi:pimeloyl-ACP methyl ester carboxylesterase